MSSPADCLVSALINDDATFQRLMAENRRRLADSAAFVRDWFSARGMHPQQSNAGHFMLIDVRDRLGVRTWDDEKDIALKSVPAGVLVVSRCGRHRTAEELVHKCRTEPAELAEPALLARGARGRHKRADPHRAWAGRTTTRSLGGCG